MNILIFDTETTDLNKCFCYNVGYIIANTETQEILLQEDFVVEQIWHNLPLFNTAYYANKRNIYISDMRAKKTKLKKWGHVTQRLANLIKQYNVQGAYAYNSPFDDKVFNFNCNWFKTINPFDNVPIYDIRGYVFKELVWSKEYQNFCDNHSLYTDTGAYSSTAESIYKFITNNENFIEDHTALSDSLIEWEILKYCVNDDWNTEHKIYSSIPRKVEKNLKLLYKDKEYNFKYETMKFKNKKTELILK